MDTSLQIDSLRKQLLVQSVKNELRYIIASDKETLQEKKLQLDTVLAMIEKTDDTGKKKDVEKMFDEVDKVIFKRPWNRLPPIHKLLKIKEYLATAVPTDDQLRTQIYDKLVIQVNSGKLNTKKHVVYDPVKEQIESIPVLKIDSSS